MQESRLYVAKRGDRKVADGTNLEELSMRLRALRIEPRGLTIGTVPAEKAERKMGLGATRASRWNCLLEIIDGNAMMP